MADRLSLKQRQNHYSSRRAVDTKNKKIVKFYSTFDNWRNTEIFVSISLTFSVLFTQSFLLNQVFLCLCDHI